MADLLEASRYRKLTVEEREELLEILIAEREQALEALRYACQDFGDNNWAPSKPLHCIINGHLMRYIRSALDVWNGDRLRVKYEA